MQDASHLNCMTKQETEEKHGKKETKLKIDKASSNSTYFFFTFTFLYRKIKGTLIQI